MRLRADSEALHARCSAQDPVERRAGLQELGRLLYRITWARVKDQPSLRGSAEDAVQEALVTIHGKLVEGEGPQPGSFVSWSARIAVNKLLDEIRRLEPRSGPGRSKRVARSRQESLDAPRDEDGQPLGESLADPRSQEADDALAAGELRALLMEIRDIEAVSEQSRTVLLYGFLGEEDDAALAARLDTSRPNVHVIRCRDLAKLRDDESFMRRLGELRP